MQSFTRATPCVLPTADNLALAEKPSPLRRAMVRAPRHLRRLTAVSLGALGVCTAIGSASAQTKLLFNSFIPPTHPVNTQVFQPWVKEVAQATNGRVAIEFAASNLAPPPGQLDLVVKGGADIAYQYSGVVPNRLYLFQASEVPGSSGSAQATAVAMWRTYEKYFAAAGETKGVKTLALFTLPKQNLQSLKDNITTIDQLKRMKIATTPGLASKVYGHFSSGIVTSPAVRFFEFVSKGTVDAYGSVSPIDVLNFNLARDTKYMISIPGIGPAPTFLLAMNEGKWSALAKADQDAINGLGGEAFARRIGALDAANDAVLKQLAAQGMTMTSAPQQFGDEFRRIAKPVEDDWIAEANKRGVDGKAALEFYRAQIAAAGK